MEEMIDYDQLADDIEVAEGELVELKKALTLSTMMRELEAMEQFHTVIAVGFVTSYRETAVVNIGLVRGDAQDGIKIGLIGRAQFEHYCISISESFDGLTAQIEQTEAELLRDKKLLAQAELVEEEDEEA